MAVFTTSVGPVSEFNLILVVFIAPGSVEEIGAKILIVVVGNDSLFLFFILLHTT